MFKNSKTVNCVNLQMNELRGEGNITAETLHLTANHLSCLWSKFHYVVSKPCRGKLLCPTNRTIRKINKKEREEREGARKRGGREGGKYNYCVRERRRSRNRETGEQEPARESSPLQQNHSTPAQWAVPDLLRAHCFPGAHPEADCPSHTNFPRTWRGRNSLTELFLLFDQHLFWQLTSKDYTFRHFFSPSSLALTFLFLSD